MLTRPARTLALSTIPLGEYLDVLGLNEYLGWYGGRPEDADRMQWKFAWDKPVIMSEFGAEAPYGRHGEADERWTEEYQANLYQHQIAMLKKIPSLAGMSPWVLMDFHSPRRLLPGTQDYYNRKGLVSNHGTAQAGVLRVAEVLSGMDSGNDPATSAGRDGSACRKAEGALSRWVGFRPACGPEIPSAMPSGWLPACLHSISWDRP